MIRLFWGVALMLHPFIFKISNFPANRQGKDHFMLMVIALSVTLFAGNQTLPKFEKCVLGFLTVYSTLNYMNFYAPAAIYQSIYFFAGITLVSQMHRTMRKSDFTYLLRFFAVSAVTGVIFAVISRMGYSVYYVFGDIIAEIYNLTGISKLRIMGGPNYPAGPLNNGNLDGAYLAFALPAIFRKKWCYLAPIFILGLWLHNSLAAWISAAGVCLYWGLLKYFPKYKLWPFYVAFIGMVVMFASSYMFNFGHDSGRFLIWKLGLQLTTWKTFVFGNGLGWFGDNFSRYFIINKGNARHEHNEFLATYFAFGAFGLGLFLSLIWRAVKNTEHKPALVGMFAIFVDSIANFNFHISPLAVMGIFYYVYCLKTAEVRI